MKVCFVSIIGRPNVGKSTLLNSILNYNLSIVTPVAQTTRNQINGVYNDKDYQIIFIDTPGIHKKQNKFGEYLNNASYDSIKDVDLVLFLSPSDEEISTGDELIIEKIQNVKNKIAIITKVDLVKNKELLDEKAKLLKIKGFDLVMGSSNIISSSVDEIINEVKKYSYDHEPFYDTEYITDKSVRFMAKEILREAAILHLKQELPHSIAVIIDEFNEKENEPIEIKSTIYVARESQKGIIIGHKGKMLKKIGTYARKKMQIQFDMPIILKTTIKVNKNWINDEKQFKKLLG